jgi:hypothetical protein
MALKLFRTTGYSTLLLPGETRVAPHPARLVLRGSLWLAIACNVGVWRLLAHGGDWREALTFAFLAGAVLATGLWSQQLPVASVWQGPPSTWLPGWASFMRWQALALLFLLAVVPIVSAWNARARRLSGPAQLQSNLLGAGLAAALFAAGVLLSH